MSLCLGFSSSSEGMSNSAWSWNCRISESGFPFLSISILFKPTLHNLLLPETWQIQTLEFDLSQPHAGDLTLLLGFFNYTFLSFRSWLLSRQAHFSPYRTLSWIHPATIHISNTDCRVFIGFCLSKPWLSAWHSLGSPEKEGSSWIRSTCGHSWGGGDCLDC